MAYYYPLTIYRGDTHRWGITLWQDAAHTDPVDLTGVQDHHAPAGGGQRGLDQLGVHPTETVAVLHHHDAHLGVGEQPPGLGPGTVHPGPDLGLHPHHP